MRIWIVLALLMIAFTSSTSAQDTTSNEWPLQAVQFDFALFPMGTSFVLSWSGAVDLDFFVAHKHIGGSVSLVGCQLGISQFVWPYVEYDEDERYFGTDFDLLLRHTYKTYFFRTDIVTGLSIRDGDYENTRIGIPFGPREESLSAGLKLGGAVTFMLIRPAIAIRFKLSGRFFGFKPIEGGALGLGLVVGWQRDDL